MEIHRLEEILFFLNFATSSVMTGLILLVQMVHYPMFDRLERRSFPESMVFHQQRISVIVVPVMVLEFIVAVGLTVIAPRPLTFILLGLVGLIWASTVFIQIPLHEALTQGHSPAALRDLVRKNWYRTVSWLLRSLLCLYGCLAL